MTQIKTNKRKRLFPLGGTPTLWNSNPFQNFLSYDNLFNDDFFEGDSLLPAMNVKENEDNYEIEFAAPGFSKKEFEISIENDMLHVSGERRAEKEEEDLASNYYRKEFNYNSFRRSLKLPANINLESNLKATYKNGILKLKLLKLEEVAKETEKLIEIE